MSTTEVLSDALGYNKKPLTATAILFDELVDTVEKTRRAKHPTNIVEGIKKIVTVCNALLAVDDVMRAQGVSEEAEQLILGQEPDKRL